MVNHNSCRGKEKILSAADRWYGVGDGLLMKRDLNVIGITVTRTREQVSCTHVSTTVLPWQSAVSSVVKKLT